MSLQIPGADDLVEVIVVGVNLLEMSRHFVEFQEKGGDRRLQVLVGAPEAAAIAFALQGRTMPRPMTHDALKQVIDAVEGRVAQIVFGYVSDKSTFTADVVIALADGTKRHLDWRLSDAVAVAVRWDPPPTILVPASLLAGPGSVGAAGYRLPCPACQAPVHIAEGDLRPVNGVRDLATADVGCPSCNTDHTVQVRVGNRAGKEE